MLAVVAVLSLGGCQFRPAGAANGSSEPGAIDGGASAGPFDAAAGGGGGGGGGDADASGPPDSPDAGLRALGLVPTGSATVLGSLGGNGGSPFTADCPDGRVVTGFDADDNDSGLCQAQAICSRVIIGDDGSGSLSLTDPVETSAHGSETSVYPLDPVKCPAGQVVVGYDGSETNLVRRIRPHCAALTWDGTTYALGQEQEADNLGRFFGQSRGPWTCGDGQVVAGFQGRAGSLLDHVELRCYALAPATD